MHRYARFTLSALIALFLVSSVFAQSSPSPSSGQMQGMSCCMMGGGGMGMSVMVTLSVLVALLLLSATTALFALTVFLLRRSRPIPTQS